MLNVTWALMVPSGLVRGDETVPDLQAAQDAVWAAYRAAGPEDTDVSMGLALAFAQATRDAPEASVYESLLVRVSVTPTQ